MQLLNAGCGTHYADGWVNTDVWENETTTPDVKVEPGQKYPFEENTFDAVFLGHVLEHIPWKEVTDFLLDMKRVAKPNAKFLICGPDIYRTIERYAKGEEPKHILMAALEHQDLNLQPGREHEWWDGAHHHWNCHHDRVAELLQQCGFTEIQDLFDVIPKSPAMKGWQDGDIHWPIVGHWHWHFAIGCVNSK
jgi:SAM-dependent methyltransferase